LDKERIKHIIELLKSSGAAELTVREGDSMVRVRQTDGSNPNAEPVVEELQAAQAPANSVKSQDSLAEGEDNGQEIHEVRTHLVGFFHHSLEPDGETLVQVGQHVGEAQVVGAIEALRRLTEVVSPVSGEVISIDVEDGDAVQYGDVLMRIQPSARGVDGVQ